MPIFILWDTEWDFRYARLNLGWRPTPSLDLAVSAIARGLDYDATLLSDAEDMDSYSYESTSLSTSVQVSYALSHRFSVGGHGIVEVHRREGSGLSAETRTLPRFGLFTGFWF
jgi:hypothetical protein